MLLNKDAEPEEDAEAESDQELDMFSIQQADRQPCRYCSKVPPKVNSKFKLVKAKSDKSPRNRVLPPPLRFVNYCAVHHRPWLTVAHANCLDSRVIVAHISEKAQPVMGAEAGTRAGALAIVHADVARPIQKKRKVTKLDKVLAAAKRKN
jgi:hypothetical protein